jgi:peptide/nickel transport system substrate-binding protein
MVQMLRRRSVVVLVLLSLAAGACATERRQSSPTDGNRSVRDELVVAAGADTSRLEPSAPPDPSRPPPAAANVATGYGDANAPVFETLVALAPDFTVQPLLATSWEFRAPNTWRFQLRRGVQFHNGEPFDANAVVDNAKRFWTYDATLSIGADSATAVDAYTVDLTPSKPNRRLVEQLVHPLRGIRAPGTVAGSGAAPENRPTGTGPFMFSSYQKGRQLEVVRFDGYWGDKAKTRKITFRFLPDDNARVLALTAGEVDAIYDFPREQASAFANAPDFTTVKSAPGGYAALLLNHRGNPPYDILNDLRVRQAVAYAIDRATIVNNVWKGNAEVMHTLIPAAVLGRHASLIKGYTYDKAEARRLLDDAGWVPGPDGIRVKGGRRLQLTLEVSGNELQRPAPELVQSQLKDVGIDVKLDVPTSAAYYDMLEEGQGDMFAEIGSQNDANPIFLGALFTAEPGGFADYAGSFGAGAEYDRVFTQAIGSPDTEEVRRLAAQAMQIAVDKVVAVVPLAGINRVWGLRRNVQGFVPHPSSVNQKWSHVYAVG